MILKNTLGLISLSLVLLSACKKEDPFVPCDENSYEIDQSKISRKVLVIGIDGFRSDAMTANNSPFFYSLSQDPFTYFTANNKVEYLTLSGPNWTTLLSGVHWEKHGVTDNFFVGYNPSYPSFFHYVENAKPSINTVSICRWLPINSQVVINQADFSPLSTYPDLAVYNQAVKIVNGTDSIVGDVIFLHFDDLDHNGHLYGFHDSIPEYAQAVATMDAYAEGLFNAVEARRNLGEDWIVFIVSDHGGLGTSHTGMPNEPSVNQTIFYANHPTVVFKSNYISSQVDLVPSILSFLGIKNAGFDCKTDGVSLIE